MKLTLSEHFEARIQIGHVKELLDAALDVLQPLSVEHVCYLSMGRPEIGEISRIETNYPGDWFNRYHERDYMRIDPVVAAGRNSLRSINWRDIDKSSREISGFFGEAADFGLRENGLTVPIRDTEDRRALFTINGAAADRDWDAIIGEHGSDMRFVAFLFHLYYERARQNHVDDCPHLSERELQVLGWAAAGKSAWETSMILGLSQRTIDAYIRNCIRKLGVANKTQAVAVAVSYHLLNEQVFRQCAA